MSDFRDCPNRAALVSAGCALVVAVGTAAINPAPTLAREGSASVNRADAQASGRIGVTAGVVRCGAGDGLSRDVLDALRLYLEGTRFREADCLYGGGPGSGAPNRAGDLCDR